MVKVEGLNEYKIQINDVLDKASTIKASTLDEAIDKAIEMYIKDHKSYESNKRSKDVIKKTI